MEEIEIKANEIKICADDLKIGNIQVNVEEIKVGEYVRTYEGIIGIVKYKDTNNIVIITNDEEIELSSGIYKNSFNIIYLIEEGDYVNGELVIDIIPILDEELNQIGRKLLTQYRVAQYKGTVRNYYILEKDIKSIVTKEMMESIEYKVGK